MKELSIQETIEDLEQTIDKLKEQLIYIVNEDLNEYIRYKVIYYQNIIDWLKELQEVKEKEQDDGK